MSFDIFTITAALVIGVLISAIIMLMNCCKNR
jgi:hypothetical protein